jgi:CheY-like chemotaxis protein
VITASGGKEACDVFVEHANEIDLVILDMIMPGMGGGGTFDFLKSVAPNIKVLLCSGYSLDGQAKDILKRGCNGFIQSHSN